MQSSVKQIMMPAATLLELCKTRPHRGHEWRAPGWLALSGLLVIAYDEKSDTHLVEDIRHNGCRYRPQVVLHNGEMVLARGFRRIMAMIEMGMLEIPVDFIEAV